MGVVIDASLLAAIALNEPSRRAVQAALRGWRQANEQIHAPSLIHYELASALAKSVSRGAIDADTVRFVFERLQRLPIAYHDLRDAVPQMVEVASQLRRRSAYDAAYLVLSRRLQAPLATLDGSLYRNASDLGFAVELIQ